jgi:hypothetical protein
MTNATERHEQEAFDTLDALDEELDALPYGALSLAPGRSRATRLRQLVEDLAASCSDRSTSATSLASALARVIRAELHHFPENLFWDSDALAASLASHPDESALAERVAIIESLMSLYGVNGPVRFQYVHDFAYGFDWAAWVARKPEDRAGIPPFGMPFLAYSERRGREIHALAMRGDDTRYPRIEGDARRNVFGFSRAPDAELRLMRALAAEAAIPVHAWTPDATSEWRRDYQSVRARLASES